MSGVFSKGTAFVATLVFLATAAGGQTDPPPPPQSVWELYPNGMPQTLELRSGERFRFEYDALHRLRRVEAPDPHFLWELDEAGRRQAATSDLGTVRFHYDSLDRLEEIRFEPAETRQVHFVRYDYDVGNQIKKVTVLGSDRQPRYSIDVGRDLFGRIQRLRLGGREVTFDYRDNQVVRQTPDGVRSTFTYNPQGLLSSIRHDKQETLLSQTTFDLDARRQKITVGQDVPGNPVEFRTFDAGTRHLRQGASFDMPPVYGFEGRVEVGAAGLLLRDPLAAGNQRFLRVPFDVRGELVLELNPRGGIDRALVAGERLAFEHHLGLDQKQFHLEQGYPTPYEIISYRTFHGVPPQGWSPGAWRSTLSGIDSKLRRPVEIGGGLASLGSAGIKLWKEPDGTNPGGIGRTLDRLKVATKVYRDFMDFSTSTAPVGKRFRDHVLLGQTSESLLSGLVSKPHLGGFVAGQGVGLGRDLLLGKGLGNPDVLEHLADTILLGGAALWIAEGNPAAAGPVASALQGAASLGRTWSRPYFEQAGSWWGRTSRSLQGQHVWQLATAALYGDPGRVRDLMGDLGDRTRLSRGQADAFETAALSGDRRALADLLPSFERVLHAAGYDDHAIARLADSLRAGPVSGMPSGSLSSVGDQLGGVEIDMKVDFVGELGHIEGAVYDPVLGTVALVGDGAPEAPRLDPDELAVALSCIFGPHGRGPSFSLDPADLADPDGPWQKAVYRPEHPLRSSRFGYVMWATDWAMKQAAFGTEVRYGPWLTSIDAAQGVRSLFELWTSGEVRSFTLVEHDRRYLGFDSVADVLFAHPDWMPAGGLRARQWIVVRDGKVTARLSDGALLFDRIELDVKAKRMEVEPGGRLRDVETREPVSSTFARGYAEALRTRLPAIAEREPAFLELPELVRAVAFARWLRDQRVPIDLSWVEKRLRQPGPRWTADGVPLRDSVAQVSRLETQHVGPHGDWGVVLSGGVDLDFDVEVRPDDGRATALRREVSAALGTAETASVRLTGGRRAAVLPLTRQGQQRWYRSASLEKDGVRYRLGENGRVRSATDAAGNEVSYEWRGEELAAIVESTPGGWTTRWWEDGDGAVRESLSPDGRRRRFVRRSDGSTSWAVDGRVRLTGRPLADGGYETRELADGESAVTVHDAAGRVVSYRREAGPSAPAGEELDFEYWEDGRLRRIALAGRSILTLTWEGERIASMTMGSRRWAREDAADGSRRRLRGPGGESVEVTAGTGGRTIVAVEELGRSWRYVYRGGRLVSTVDPEGRETSFVYDGEGRLVREESGGRTQRSARYDARGRLTEARVPGVAEARFDYSGEGAEHPRRVVVQHLGER